MREGADWDTCSWSLDRRNSLSMVCFRRNGSGMDLTLGGLAQIWTNCALLVVWWSSRSACFWQGTTFSACMPCITNPRCLQQTTQTITCCMQPYGRQDKILVMKIGLHQGHEADISVLLGSYSVTMSNFNNAREMRGWCMDSVSFP
jgi:hypothetical protein